MKNTQKSLPKPIDDLRKARYWPKNIPMPKAGAYSGGSRWTHEEERLLKRYYPLYGGRYCARLLGRTPAGIRMHARHLHLNSDSRFWSEEDIARLKREYGTMPNAKLARTFGRDVEQMLTKARLLGLRTQAPRWSAKELSVLRSLYGTVPVKQIAARLKRPRGSVQQLALRLGLAKKRTPMTKKIERAIVKQVMDRTPITQIAAQFHTTTPRIHEIARAHGCELTPGARAGSWRQEEDMFLREHYSTMRVIDIAEHLGRSATSVHTQARQLGIPIADAYAAGEVRWTAADETTLRKQYGRVKTEELAERLGRTPLAVRAHAEHLGLSLRAANPELPQLWKPEEDATLRRLFQTKTNKEIAEYLGRPLGSVIARGNKLGLKKDRPWFREWTAREDTRLRQLDRTLSPKEIAERLGRTLMAVRSRMYKLGLLTVQTSKPSVWTAKEDRLLTKLSERHSWEEVAARLGRSVHAVKSRASRTRASASANEGKQDTDHT